MNKRTVTFTHASIEGSPYEAGLQLGNLFKEEKDFIHTLTSPMFDGQKLSNKQISFARKMLNKYCPGTVEEIQGFSDAIGVNSDNVVYFYSYLQIPGQCSHFAFIPKKESENTIYLARNYDYSWNDRPVLITSKINGQYNHIGFGCQLFGRFDGTNEYGLCITTSAGVIQPDYKESGFVFPVIVRAILNSCKTVSEALDVIKNMPISDYRNFIIVDSNGDGALIEVASSKLSIMSIKRGTKNQYLYSTNHYQMPSMTALGYPVTQHSVDRLNAIREFFSVQKEDANIDNIKELLAKPIPHGLGCPHYSDGMGTLWSMVLQPENKCVDICLGNPSYNKWHRFDLAKPSKSMHYKITLTSIPAIDGFWDKI